jgi:hypothetical protein
MIIGNDSEDAGNVSIECEEGDGSELVDTIKSMKMEKVAQIGKGR